MGRAAIGGRVVTGARAAIGTVHRAARQVVAGPRVRRGVAPPAPRVARVRGPAPAGIPAAILALLAIIVERLPANAAGRGSGPGRRRARVRRSTTGRLATPARGRTRRRATTARRPAVRRAAVRRAAAGRRRSRTTGAHRVHRATAPAARRVPDLPASPRPPGRSIGQTGARPARRAAHTRHDPVPGPDPGRTSVPSTARSSARSIARTARRSGVRSSPASPPSRSPKARRSSPGAAPSRRRSSRVGRPAACSSCPSVATRSKSSCCTRPACGSPSSRSRAGR